jgi:hypothetical protein
MPSTFLLVPHLRPSQASPGFALQGLVDAFQLSKVVALTRDASPTKMDFVSRRTAAAKQGQDASTGGDNEW